MKAGARLRRIFSGRHAMLSGALVVLAAGGLRPLAFTRELPPGVPELSRWNKASGSEELDGKLLQYELYYDNGRSDYELIRYRLTGGSADDGLPYSPNERMQWQAALKDLRRFECEPLAAGGCAWRELDKKSPEYARELRMVLRVLGLHRRLLYEREAGGR
jgi:hypothetical protein